MALEIRHNRAENTHENVQFRRVALSLIKLFEQKSWDGIFIGNPFNENFMGFRADAILLYNYGLLIIDFKDYQGSIKLPEIQSDFENQRWYVENDLDKDRIELKGGSNFINPFRQLKYYRQIFFEVVHNNLFLGKYINPSRTCAVNILSGPIKIVNKIPGIFPFYKIIQEKEFPEFLYDFSSENTYNKDCAKSLRTIFQSDLWEESRIDLLRSKTKPDIIHLNEDVEKQIVTFLQKNSNGLLVLKSMDSDIRDKWMKYILSESVNYNIPQTEVWGYSSRICGKLRNRVHMSFQSCFNAIYGGNPYLESNDDEQAEEESRTQEIREIVPIKTDNEIDDASLIIIHEAHLVSRSLQQSDLLRFGTGRLLEDLINFLDIEKNKRKIIFIGDPYSLTYGRDDDCSLNINTLRDLYNGEIICYDDAPDENNCDGILGMRTNIALSIKQKKYNLLRYQWHDDELIHIDNKEVENHMHLWFKDTVEQEPEHINLVYMNKDAKRINKWVKLNCLKNGEELNKGDLLIINNNVNIPDLTGFGHPTKLNSGMFLLVKEIVDKAEHEQLLKKGDTKPIILKFIKIKVQCISMIQKIETEVWLLDNYLISDDNYLSKDEQIAFRILLNEKVNTYKKDNPFEKTDYYKDLINDNNYIQIESLEYELTEKLSQGDRVKTKLEDVKRKKRKIERDYQKRYRQQIIRIIRMTDPFANAIYARYGWAITVHKAVGSQFSKVILNARWGENNSISNPEYFRWLYSGLTSSSVCYVVNSKEIHPLNKCHFDISETLSEKSMGSKKMLLIYNDYSIPDDYQSIVSLLENNNVIGTVCELSKLLSHEMIFLKTVSKMNDYLTKIHYFKKGDDSTDIVLAIHNKGTKDNNSVSKVQIEKNGNIDRKILDSKIITLFDEFQYKDKSSVLPSDFRGDIYKSWISNAKRDGFNINLVSSHPYQDLFRIKSDSESGEVKMWYTGAGFFTKIEIHISKGSDLDRKIKSWISNIINPTLGETAVITGNNIDFLK